LNDIEMVRSNFKNKMRIQVLTIKMFWFYSIFI